MKMSTEYPCLMMKASTMHNGTISRWRIYKERAGVPYSYYIDGQGYSVFGHGDSFAAARAKIGHYYSHTEIQS
jgi:hypothetical protein